MLNISILVNAFIKLIECSQEAIVKVFLSVIFGKVLEKMVFISTFKICSRFDRGPADDNDPSILALRSDMFGF
jgi:hypothetical protein